MRVSHVNVITDWTPEQDDKLRELYFGGEAILEIAHLLNTSVSAVQWRCRKLNMRRDNRVLTQGALARPEDFADYAETSTVGALRTRYGVGEKTVQRWLRELGLGFGKRKPKDVPEDWAKMAPHYRKMELVRLYNVTINDVRHWIKVTGIDAMPYNHVKKPYSPSREQLIEIEKIEPKVFDRDTQTIAPFAGKYLQRYYPSVHRADIRLYEATKETWGSVRGLPDKGRNHFYVSGKGTLWLDEVIELAVKHGFNPQGKQTQEGAA